jgi:hypothetical protein
MRHHHHRQHFHLLHHHQQFLHQHRQLRRRRRCRLLLLLVSLQFFVLAGFGQTCIHNDLSRTLRISTRVLRKRGDTIIAQSVPIEVTITEKAGRKISQKISFSASELYSKSFTRCNAVRSYSTGKNRHADVVDTDFGDVVVADFNFDSREDIAIKSADENAGTYYRFYIQGEDHLFKLDSFLTDSMMVPPTYYNPAKKTLTTYKRAGVREGEQVYHLDVRKNKWTMIRHRFIPPMR